VAVKLRHRGREARGVCVWMRFCEGGGFAERKMYAAPVYANADVWRRASELFALRPKRLRVKIMGVYVYGLESSGRAQLSILEDVGRKDALTAAVDELNDFYGAFTMHSADALIGSKIVKQKIPFGGTEYFNLLLKRA